MDRENTPRLRRRPAKTYKQGDVLGRLGWTVLGRSDDKWAMLCPGCGNIVVGIANNISEQSGCDECVGRGQRVEDVETGDVYRTVVLAAKAIGVAPGTMSRALRSGRLGSKIQHHWRYTDKPVTVEVEEEDVVTIPRSRYEELLRKAGEA